MTITITKENMFSMLPTFHKMIEEYGSVTVHEWWDSSMEAAEKSFQNWEYIKVPQDAIDDPQKFLEFVNQPDV
jgi:hypothetical protein